MAHPPPTVDFSVTQNIPVADHVYKYLKTRCGSDHIIASRTTIFGSLVLGLLTRNGDVKPKKSGFTKIFKATITEDSGQRGGMFISADNAQIFNDQVDKMFREELFFHVVINKGIDARMYLQSIRTFLQVYDITEDDLKIDTIYRDFKRRKDHLDSSLNLTSSSG